MARTYTEAERFSGYAWRDTLDRLERFVPSIRWQSVQGGVMMLADVIDDLETQLMAERRQLGEG